MFSQDASVLSKPELCTAVSCTDHPSLIPSRKCILQMSTSEYSSLLLFDCITQRCFNLANVSTQAAGILSQYRSNSSDLHNFLQRGARVSPFRDPHCIGKRVNISQHCIRFQINFRTTEPKQWSSSVRQYFHSLRYITKSLGFSESHQMHTQYVW